MRYDSSFCVIGALRKSRSSIGDCSQRILQICGDALPQTVNRRRQAQKSILFSHNVTAVWRSVIPRSTSARKMSALVRKSQTKTSHAAKAADNDDDGDGTPCAGSTTIRRIRDHLGGMRNAHA